MISCDKLINQTVEMIDVFIKKYWETSDVTVLGYKEPTYKSDFVKFESLGVDTGVSEVCQQLHDFFSNKEDKHFMLSVSDMPIVDYVDTELVDFYRIWLY